MRWATLAERSQPKSALSAAQVFAVCMLSRATFVAKVYALRASLGM
jgi:hypothetical protein